MFRTNGESERKGSSKEEGIGGAKERGGACALRVSVPIGREGEITIGGSGNNGPGPVVIVGATPTRLRAPRAEESNCAAALTSTHASTPFTTLEANQSDRLQ